MEVTKKEVIKILATARKELKTKDYKSLSNTLVDLNIKIENNFN